MSTESDESNTSDFTEINSPWDNFVKSDDGSQATCKTCNHTLKTTKGNTTGLHYHLSIHNIRAKKVFRKRKVAEIAEAQTAPFKKANLGEEKSALATEKSLFGMISRMCSKRGFSFRVFQEDDDLRECLNAMMLKLKRDEQVPSSNKTIRSNVLQYFNRVRDQVKASIRKLKMDGYKFSLVFDEWSSKANKRYMNVIVFGPYNLSWSLGLIKITGSATAERLMELLLERLEDFGIDYNDDIVGITTDGCATMVKLGKDESLAQHQLCLIHGIHLAVVDLLYVNSRRRITDPIDEIYLDSSCEDEIASIEETECLEGFEVLEPEEEEVHLKDADIKQTIGKVRQLGRWFNKSAISNEILQSYVKAKFNTQNSKRLFIDSKTRWNSMYDMLERYIDIEDCVDKTLIDIKSNLSVSSQEKYIIRCILKTLKPVKSVIVKLSARDSNLHQAYMSIKWLFNELQKHDNTLTNKFAERLYLRIKARFTVNFGVIRYLALGSYSNTITPKATAPAKKEKEPHTFQFSPLACDDSENEVDANTETHDKFNYFSLFEVPTKKSIKAHLLKLIKLLFPSADAVTEAVPVVVSNIQSEQSFDDQLNSLFSDPENSIDAVEPQDMSDISKRLTYEMNLFEKAHERTGYLSKMYDCLMTMRPTSVESERAFSQAAYLVTKFRSRLGDETLDALFFLRSFNANPCVYKEYEE